MADVKISALPAATAIGADLVAGVHTGTTSQLTAAKIGVTAFDGSADIAAISEPSAPASGNGRLFLANAGPRFNTRVMLGLMPPASSGFPTYYQPHLGFSLGRQLMPGGGTTAATVATAHGCGYTATATTFASPAPTSGSKLNRSSRWTQATNATAGQLATLRMSVVQCFIEGGFFFLARYFLSGTLQTGQRGFFGLWDSSAVATNIDPLADTGRAKLGMGFNLNTGNWFSIHNTSGSSPTTSDMGGNYPLNTTDVHEFTMWCPPGSSTIWCTLYNLTTGSNTTFSFASNNPASTAALCPQFWTTNTAASAIVTFGMMRAYLETDE